MSPLAEKIEESLGNFPRHLRESRGNSEEAAEKHLQELCEESKEMFLKIQ